MSNVLKMVYMHKVIEVHRCMAPLKLRSRIVVMESRGCVELDTLESKLR
jgi:hypothetical protein